MKPATPHFTPRFLRVDAGAIADGAGFAAAPASILIQLSTATDSLRGAQGSGEWGGWHSRTLAVGRAAEVRLHEANRSPELHIISRPDCTILPGLVNAHTHLDLTHIGPRPHDPLAGFVPWVDMVRAARHTDDEPIAASVRLGVELSLAAGTVAIGDIAGAPKARSNLTPWRTMRALGMRGVSYLEFFSIGKNRLGTLDWVEKLVAESAIERGAPGCTLGLQPHATNTVALSSYRRAIEIARDSGGLPLSTHLAETPEERRFIGEAAGPQRELLERFGLWTDDILDDIGRGHHPVAHMADILAMASDQTGHPMLVAHVNDADDAAIETLARTRTSVAYCPTASEYFGLARHFGTHRYRDMLAAGICVALGTDSIVNLPPDAADPSIGMSILREMRRLHRRDSTDPRLLLQMATMNGAVALGLDQRAFRFAPGHPVGGMIAVHATGLHQALRTESGGDLLFCDNHCGITVMN